MPKEPTSFKLKNALTELDSLFEHIERFGRTAGLPKKQIFQINLALDELFTNIVSYGFPDSNSHWINFRLHLENNEVVIRIEDNGIPFDPVAAPTAGSTPPLEKCKIGGLGLHIVKKMMDEIAYERRGDKNITLTQAFIYPLGKFNFHLQLSGLFNSPGMRIYPGNKGIEGICRPSRRTLDMRATHEKKEST